jgi:hypothetical protein
MAARATHATVAETEPVSARGRTVPLWLRLAVVVVGCHAAALLTPGLRKADAGFQRSGPVSALTRLEVKTPRRAPRSRPAVARLAASQEASEGRSRPRAAVGRGETSYPGDRPTGLTSAAGRTSPLGPARRPPPLRC